MRYAGPFRRWLLIASWSLPLALLVACPGTEPCKPGGSCAAVDVCHEEGVYQCQGDTLVCATGALKPDGASCRTNSICLAGVCKSCGELCQSLNPCHTAKVSCASGAPQCTDDGNKANGTSCGTGQVCTDGACVACTPGGTCQPSNVCHVGTLACATGRVCQDTGTPVANGTTCDAGKVCNGGTCVACAAGTSCPSANPCHTASISCASGSAVCTDDGNQPDGTVCGAGQTCSAGTCIACVPGSACAPVTNPCHVGTQVCGAPPTCTDTGALQADGTACGTGLTCFSGLCSRTVTGTRILSYWPDSGRTDVVPDNSTVVPVAYAPDGGGGWVVRTGSFGPLGTFSISGVPPGSYILDVQLSVVGGAAGAAHQMVVTSAGSVDLGWDILGRADQAYAASATQVTYQVSGLEPWTANTGTPGVGDYLQVTSSNADAFDAPVGPWYGLDFPAGATSGTKTGQWYTHLVDAAKGDVTYFHQLATHSTTVGPTTYSYRTAVRSASHSNVTVANGLPVTIPVALGPVAFAGTLQVNWPISQFDAYLQQINPSAAGSTHQLYVSATPHGLVKPSPLALDGSPQMFLFGAPSAVGDVNLGALPYGQVFADRSTLWKEWRGAEYFACVVRTAPGAASGRTFCGSISRLGEATAPAPPTPIVPILTPPRNPAINGLDAFQDRSGVGTTPTLSWTAPTVGLPSHYALYIFRLVAAGTGTTWEYTAYLQTGATSVTVPPGILEAGKSYFALLWAEQVPNDDFEAAPFHLSTTITRASAVTAVFSP